MPCHRRYLILAIYLMLFGCGGTKWDSITDSFALYDSFATQIAKCETFDLYEGLPHPVLEQAVYGEERGAKNWSEMKKFLGDEWIYCDINGQEAFEAVLKKYR